MNPFSFLEKLSAKILKLLAIFVAVIVLIPILFILGFAINFSHFGQPDSQDIPWLIVLPAGFVLVVVFIVYLVGSRNKN